MTWQTLVMFALAGVFGLAGIVLLVRLRLPLSAPAAYAHRIAGLMLAMLGLILAGFATALWSWSTT